MAFGVGGLLGLGDVQARDNGRGLICVILGEQTGARVRSQKRIHELLLPVVLSPPGSPAWVLADGQPVRAEESR